MVQYLCFCVKMIDQLGNFFFLFFGGLFQQLLQLMLCVVEMVVLFFYFCIFCGQQFYCCWLFVQYLYYIEVYNIVGVFLDVVDWYFMVEVWEFVFFVIVDVVQYFYCFGDKWDIGFIDGKFGCRCKQVCSGVFLGIILMVSGLCQVKQKCGLFFQMECYLFQQLVYYWLFDQVFVKCLMLQCVIQCY